MTKPVKTPKRIPRNSNVLKFGKAEPAACQQCGRALPPPPWHKDKIRFCSYEHAAKWHAKHAPESIAPAKDDY